MTGKRGREPRERPGSPGALPQPREETPMKDLKKLTKAELLHLMDSLNLDIEHRLKRTLKYQKKEKCTCFECSRIARKLNITLEEPN
jgi:hypothetical protein